MHTRDARHILQLGPRAFWQLVRSGVIRQLHTDSARLWRVTDVMAYRERHGGLGRRRAV